MKNGNQMCLQNVSIWLTSSSMDPVFSKYDMQTSKISNHGRSLKMSFFSEKDSLYFDFGPLYTMTGSQDLDPVVGPQTNVWSSLTPCITTDSPAVSRRIITGDALHSRAACTQPCIVNTHSRAHCSRRARLCEQWVHGCVNNRARLCASARLCRGSPVILGLYSLKRCCLMGIGIPIINLGRSGNLLKFIMGTPNTNKTVSPYWIEALLLDLSVKLGSESSSPYHHILQGSTLSFLAGCPMSHFLGWHRNFLIYWYLKWTTRLSTQLVRRIN